MKQRRFQNLITKIKVQKQLYIIYFIAMFIPFASIGGYLVFNTRSLLFEHYEEQAYSDNLRVKSLLLDLTLNIYNKSNSLSSDKELIRILSTEYNSADKPYNALNDYKGIQTILTQDASIQQISIYTWNTALGESSYIYQITDEIKKEHWFQVASSTELCNIKYGSK